MSRRLTVLLATVCSAIFFDALDLSITQVALPRIQADLGVGPAVLPWVAAGYVVAYGGVLLLGGRCSDVVGPRPMFLVGLGVFAVASLACGLSPTVAVLVTARVVQGVGAALTVPAAVAVLAGSFAEGPVRTRAFATFAVAASSGFSAGLVLGGLLTDGLSWRWIFLAKVPAVVAALIAAFLVVPPTGAGGARRRLDVAGAVTITVAAAAILLGVTMAGSPGSEPVTVVVPLAVGAVLLAVFVVVERRSRDPLLPARLLRRRRAIVTDVAALTVLAAPFGVSYLVTVYVQGVLGRSPWTTAVLLLPGAVLSALVGQLIAGRFLDRFGLRATFAGALVVVAVGDAGLLALSPSAAFPVIVVAALVALGLGMGVAYPAATLGGITGVDEVDHGTAAGLTNTALQLGGGLGLAVVAALLAGGTGGADLAHAHPDVVAAAFRDATFGAVGLPLVGALVVVVGLAERRPSPGLS